MKNILEHKLLERRVDLGILTTRLSIGVLMLLHGIFKLQNGIGMIEGMITEAGLPTFFAYGVYVGEVVVPILIILGIATRLAAGIFAVNCLVAVLMVHATDIISLNAVGGWGVELLGLYFFGAVALVFTGGGKYAVSKKYIWD